MGKVSPRKSVGMKCKWLVANLNVISLEKSKISVMISHLIQTRCVCNDVRFFKHLAPWQA